MFCIIEVCNMLFIKQNGVGYELINSNIRIHGEGWIYVPASLESELIFLYPNVLITASGDTAISVEAHQFPVPEPPAPTETTEQKLEALTRSFNLTTSAMYAYMEGNS